MFPVQRSVMVLLAVGLLGLLLSYAGLAETSTADARCYEPQNAGSVAPSNWRGCGGLYIVKDLNELQRGVIAGFKITHQGVDYTFGKSAHTLFTGQVTSLAELFSPRPYYFANELLGSEHNKALNIEQLNSLIQAVITFDADISHWDVSRVTDMQSLFTGARNFNADISAWDVAQVTTMRDMFARTEAFNADISGWDVANVDSFRGMFLSALAFNRDLSQWAIKADADLTYFLYAAPTFNQDLSAWPVTERSQEPESFSHNASAWSLPQPCWGCKKEPLQKRAADWRCYEARYAARVAPLSWQGCAGLYIVKDKDALKARLAQDDTMALKVFTGQVTDMAYLFSMNQDFDQDIGFWDVSSVRDMSGMFAGASAFNQDISLWDVSQVQAMAALFYQAQSFNQDLSSWLVQGLAQQPEAFDTLAKAWDKPRPCWGCEQIAARYFNPKQVDLRCYLPSNAGQVAPKDWQGCGGLYIVTDTAELKSGISNGYQINYQGQTYSFAKSEQTIFTGQVKDFAQLFSMQAAFNDDISHWDLSSAKNLSGMFFGARAFNQDISAWNVGNADNMQGLFFGALAFNQDLSRWNVAHIANEPDGFSSNTPAWTRSKPCWAGLCR